MKKLITILTLIAALFLSATVTQAQAYKTFTKTGTNGAAKTTFTNTDTMYLTGIVQSAYGPTYGATILLTVNTGTGVGGKILWQGTINGSDWYTVKSDTLTAATNTYSFAVAPPSYNQYRGVVYTASTITATLTRGSYYYKPR